MLKLIKVYHIKMIKKVKYKFYKEVRRLYPQYGYKESDIYLSSYPKSGRNWINFLLANAFKMISRNDKLVNFHTISYWIEQDWPVPKKPPVSNVDLPRIVARHSLYEGQNVKTMYLVRDPSDVMISYYHFLTGRENKNIESISSLIRDGKYGISAWVEHFASWENHIDLLIRYEDLKKDTIGVLSDIISFIGLEEKISAKDMRNIVDRSSFERMKKVEQKWGLPSKPGKSDDFTFMRKGKTKEGREALSRKDLIYIQREAGHILDVLGYSIDL